MALSRRSRGHAPRVCCALLLGLVACAPAPQVFEPPLDVAAGAVLLAVHTSRGWTLHLGETLPPAQVVQSDELLEVVMATYAELPASLRGARSEAGVLVQAAAGARSVGLPRPLRVSSRRASDEAWLEQPALPAELAALRLAAPPCDAWRVTTLPPLDGRRATADMLGYTHRGDLLVRHDYLDAALPRWVWTRATPGLLEPLPPAPRRPVHVVAVGPRTVLVDELGAVHQSEDLLGWTETTTAGWPAGELVHAVTSTVVDGQLEAWATVESRAAPAMRYLHLRGGRWVARLVTEPGYATCVATGPGGALCYDKARADRTLSYAAGSEAPTPAIIDAPLGIAALGGLLVESPEQAWLGADRGRVLALEAREWHPAIASQLGDTIDHIVRLDPQQLLLTARGLITTHELGAEVQCTPVVLSVSLDVTGVWSRAPRGRRDTDDPWLIGLQDPQSFAGQLGWLTR